MRSKSVLLKEDYNTYDCLRIDQRETYIAGIACKLFNNIDDRMATYTLILCRQVSMTADHINNAIKERDDREKIFKLEESFRAGARSELSRAALLFLVEKGGIWLRVSSFVQLFIFSNGNKHCPCCSCTL